MKVPARVIDAMAFSLRSSARPDYASDLPVRHASGPTCAYASGALCDGNPACFNHRKPRAINVKAT
jgi:hypothetical protein